MEIKNFIEDNKQRFLDELFELLRIPSVSADRKFSQEVLKGAEFVKSKLLEAGADLAEVCETEGFPVVYAEKIINPDFPTILVYGHYDVQPADPYELWETPPFEPVVRDDKIYARGASDDKGQMYMHVKAFEYLVKQGLPCNVKFMIEGEEEVGSDHLGPFVKESKEKLKADIILISDTAMISNEVPSITMSLRGLSYVEVEVVGPNRDLHSGVYGGAVANPVNVLAEMIASLKDDSGKITIPGFYEKVIELTKEERKAMAAVPFDEEKYKADLGVIAVNGELGYSTFEHATIRPSLDVNGIWGGYTGDGAKTVLPSKAHAKISMRLVPDQDPEEISKLFTEHFKLIAPETVAVSVKPCHGGKPIVTPIDSIAYKAAERAFETTFGKKPVPLRTGGSIPIVALFKEVLGLDTILMGFGLDSDAIHSPNEHFGLYNFFKGVETITHFHKYYSELFSKG